MSNSQKQRPTLAEILGQPFTREKALNLIRENLATFDKFQSFPHSYKEQILEFIQGNRGLPILYDGFFKYVLDPFTHPERLQSLLSTLLKQKVTIAEVLTREGTQLSELGTLVIMDIVVQTEDGSYINVEMQKHGYAFTGERSICYLSDLIMRQYNRIKTEKKDNFSFKDMKPVYIIILMENSSKNFKTVAPHYVHRSQHSFDTGAEMNFLAKYIYISLDTFHSVSQNIGDTLDAWLTFLSSDDPEDIINLVEAYPEFKPLYHDISLFRKNPKELINMYSEVLLQMDKNTATYMIEELEKEADNFKKLVLEKDASLAEKDALIAELQAQLASQQNQP